MQKLTDNNREGLNLNKVLNALRLFVPRNTKTLARLKKFSYFNPEKYPEIKGIILDVDGCLAYNHQEILPENIKKIKGLTDLGIKIVIYSNMIWSPRYGKLKNVTVLKNIPAKPSGRGFEMALKILGVPRKNVVMIGDNYITDGGAIRLGIAFIHVEPLEKNEGKIVSKLGSLLKEFFIWLSKKYEKNLN